MLALFSFRTKTHLQRLHPNEVRALLATVSFPAKQLCCVCVSYPPPATQRPLASLHTQPCERDPSAREQQSRCGALRFPVLPLPFPVPSERAYVSLLLCGGRRHVFLPPLPRWGGRPTVTRLPPDDPHPLPPGVLAVPPPIRNPASETLHMPASPAPPEGTQSRPR